ncbi:unnamed protein product [Pleuronectes platessa]|uniref:Uncharacterized protein n=1 Tax=Pleuronectes platessa TaxID=8262 RepID=A0A9N7UDL0_PLEPL|nr:unnamed protein product [Pleuronectes platessa]
MYYLPEKLYYPHLSDVKLTKLKSSPEKAQQKNMTLKPQECSDTQAGPLHKRKPGRVPNGRSLETCKSNRHHHKLSDQENNPRLAHTQGKRKKKHLNKKQSVYRRKHGGFQHRCVFCEGRAVRPICSLALGELGDEERLGTNE